jgi:MurNAc alpha-1-phosphate uridylyltransferase
LSKPPHSIPNTAIVLAAGLGTRMRALTERRPKALVEVMGRPLIDHGLDRLAAAGVSLAIVNLHHFADQLETHLAGRRQPKMIFSDERERLLGTGGGVAKALSQLGAAPFVLLNSDSLWIEGATPNLARLGRAFDAGRMDGLLLLAPAATAIGYDGNGDYFMDARGALRRRTGDENAPFIYAGAAILSPAIFEDAPGGAFSLTPLFDRAQERARLFGLALEGTFLHVGTPEAVAAAEEAIRRARA